MKECKRIMCILLAVVMLITALPLTALQVSAADGDTPEVELLDYELDGNQFTISAWMTLSGGGIECYGFGYSINGRAMEYDLTYDVLGKWEEFSTTITVNPGDTIDFVAIVKNEYGLEGKSYGDFEVPEEEFDVSDTYFFFGAEGGDAEFDVFASSYYTISDNQSWISVSPQSGSSDKTITVTCDENLTDKSREGEIIVYHEGKDEEISITIEQDAGSVEAGFDFSDFWYSDEIELGENLEWGGYIELDEEDWEIVNISISIKHPDGSAIYYRETDVWDWDFDTENIQGGSIPTNAIAPKGYHPGSDGDYYEVSDFVIDEPGTYKLFVNVYAENDYTSDYDSAEYEFEVLPAPTAEILDITVSSDPVSVGEEFTITVKTNSSAYGVILYCDDMGWIIGNKVNKSSSNTYTFTYTFEKTNKTDADGYDVSNTRKILAYPYDSAGNIVTDSESMGDYNITVNPAKYEFPDFEIYDSVTVIGNSATITWESVNTQNGATVYYNLWIDNEVIAEDLTTNSYVLSAAQVEELGVGIYGIMVMASAEQYRMRQSVGSLTIKAKPDVTVYPGDINGDGAIDGTDVTKLKKYLANYDETDPAKQSVVHPIGADVNEDGKINGKDLNALLVKLENGNIEIPEPEPDPDIPSILPAVKHTYTVKIPLDKADLKATTGRTIYLMPKYGYVKLVAYDENGNAVKLRQAGITLDLSSSNGVVSFDGFTLKACKGGYGVISYTQMVNGQSVTTEIAIHVGEASASSSEWPSSYQYTKEDYEYVSMCLDLVYSIHKANMPTEYADVELNMGDIILDSCANVSEYLNWIAQRDFDMGVNVIKKSLSCFVIDYAEYLASDDAIMKKAKSFSTAFGSFIDNVDTGLSTFKDICDLLGVDFKIIAEAINQLKNDQAISDKDLKTLLQFIKKVDQDQVIKLMPNVTDYFRGLKELGFSWEAFRLTCGKAYSFAEIDIGNKITKLAKDKFFYAGLTIDAIQSIMYVAVDYSESIKVIEKLKSQLINHYDANSDEIKAIDELIVEFQLDFITAYGDLKGDATVAALMALGHPVVSIGSFAATIASNLMGISEKRDITALSFYVCALYKTLDSYMDMYLYGKATSTYDDLKFATSMYLNLIYRQNELAKSIAKTQAEEMEIDIELKEIERIFIDYLKYR